MVGRHREAEIQWNRALSLDPETPEEETRIRAKLERGLDAVLTDEAARGIAPGATPGATPAPAPSAPADNGAGADTDAD
ncbi:hypothetical protein QWZ10_13725 [Paracoccus cavernae]|uniref:Tetratricopeptide repeat protein n=2 Tax=Paracoccus cavernae TaxID=1571207 RepID=A0ABT8D703_9RHOB|nr:hypothetical protein [Paracoccus cavernae]